MAPEEARLARIAKKREPSPSEAVAIQKAKAARSKRPARVEVVSEREGATAYTMPAHRDHEGWRAQVQEAFGSRSPAFQHVLMNQMAAVMGRQADGAEDVSDTVLNYALAALESIEARDEKEAMAGASFIASHTLAMDLLAKAHRAQSMPAMEAFITMATKLSRTANATLETLVKLRNGGRQRIEVNHVHGPAVIGDNTQAIFGDARTYAHGLCGEKCPQPHEPNLRADCGAEMRGQDAGGLALSAGGNAGPQEMRLSRGEVAGGTDGQGERSLHTRAADQGTPRGPRAGASRARNSGVR